MQLKEHSSSESTLKGLSLSLSLSSPDGRRRRWLVSGDSNIAERRGGRKKGEARQSGLVWRRTAQGFERHQHHFNL